tara:strand:- start:60 stop:440 length:381 start_codon:yes stop_codon:yes gene_type:complete
MNKQLLNNGEDVHCECEEGHKVTLCRLTTDDLQTYTVDEVTSEALNGYLTVKCPKCPRGGIWSGLVKEDADGKYVKDLSSKATSYLSVDLDKITYDDIPLPTGSVSQMVNQNARRTNGTSKEWFCQ